MEGPREDDDSILARVRRLATTDHEVVSFVREIAVSVFAVVLIGLLLFAISGIWPPMVAIESGSMEPNIQTGDLVFVMEEQRLAGPGAVVVDDQSTGVVPLVNARESGYREFGSYGDVIVYQPDGNDGTTPIIHRAHFWVDEGENWYDRADPEYIGRAESCAELLNCPAPNPGFITKGDNELTNRQYDQVTGISGPVRPEWVIGTAEFRIPYLGYIRLTVSTLSSVETAVATDGTVPVEGMGIGSGGEWGQDGERVVVEQKRSSRVVASDAVARRCAV